MVTENEPRSSRPWATGVPPRRVLAVRFHAVGDVAITLPYLDSFHRLFPECAVDVLTSHECADLPRSVTAVEQTITTAVGPSRLHRLVGALRSGMRMFGQTYDIVFDLQRNRMSQVVRHCARPRAWSEFDRFSSRLAGERVEVTFHEAGFRTLPPTRSVPLKQAVRDSGVELLHRYGRDASRPLVCLNPAGAWESRSWPLNNYISIARRWRTFNGAQILLLGTDRLREKADAIGAALHQDCINLAGRTSLGEAFALFPQVSFMLSEDSGLMHMAWVSGVPTLALFGSSRHDWSAPMGPHSRCLHSGDLECGACMDPVCRFGDVHCLTRYSAETVWEVVRSMLGQVSGASS